jgi:hypothetical protein
MTADIDDPEIEIIIKRIDQKILELRQEKNVLLGKPRSHSTAKTNNECAAYPRTHRFWSLGEVRERAL